MQHPDEGDLLFREGDRGNSLYVVAKGHLRLYTTDPDGSTATLALLGAPATFGELAVFDRRRRSASAEATEVPEVVGVPAKALRDAYRADPDLAEALLRSLAALVRSATSQRSSVLFWDLHRRVAAALVAAADSGDGNAVYLDAHAATLAEQAGGSESAVTKILQQLERERAPSASRVWWWRSPTATACCRSPRPTDLGPGSPWPPVAAAAPTSREPSPPSGLAVGQRVELGGHRLAVGLAAGGLHDLADEEAGELAPAPWHRPP
ncbi:MAG: Crp/Fnr family transcriptional regulator [Acidimicrobiales bacterium]